MLGHKHRGDVLQHLVFYQGVRQITEQLLVEG